MGDKVVRAHLEAPAAAALGPPDVALLVGGVAFPTHRDVLRRGSGLLCRLLEQFGQGKSTGSGNDAGEGGTAPALQLFSADKAGAGDAQQPPKYASDPSHFGRYLECLYGRPIAVLLPKADLAEARGALELASFMDSPQLLPEIDNAIINGELPGKCANMLDNNTWIDNSTAELRQWLDLAMQHRLRRSASECLSLLAQKHLWDSQASTATDRLCRLCINKQSPLQMDNFVSLDLHELDAICARVVFSVVLKRTVATSVLSRIGCTKRCIKTVHRSRWCSTCISVIKHRRLVAVAAIEKGLFAQGWGY